MEHGTLASGETCPPSYGDKPGKCGEEIGGEAFERKGFTEQCYWLSLPQKEIYREGYQNICRFLQDPNLAIPLCDTWKRVGSFGLLEGNQMVYKLLAVHITKGKQP